MDSELYEEIDGLLKKVEDIVSENGNLNAIKFFDFRKTTNKIRRVLASLAKGE